MSSVLNFIEKINNQKGECFTLTVNSDTHYAATDCHKNVLTTSANIAQQTSDALINLGDFIRGYEDRTLDEMKGDMSGAVDLYQNETTIPILLCKGNHDDGSLLEWNKGKRSVENIIAAPLMHSKMIKPLQKYGICSNCDDEFPMYYYINFPLKKTRVYVLNCTDIPYGNAEDGQLIALGQWCYGFMSKQIEWLATTLKEVPSDWMCIFGSHIALDSGLWVEELPMQNVDVVLDIIKAFKNGTAYSCQYVANPLKFHATGRDTQPYYNGSVSVEFNCPHEVLCLSGHTHHIKTSFSDGIRHIVFPEFFSAVKTDVMIVDREKRSVSIKSYGYDGDRQFEF